MTTLQNLSSPPAANAEVQVNDNFNTLSAAAIFGKRPAATTGLTWGYYGGLYSGNTIADGTVALTNATTNYVVVLRSTGVVSVSTTTTNWNSILFARLYQLTTAGSVVTAEVDARFDTNGLFGRPQWVPVAVSDETTALTTGTAKVTFRWQGAFNLLAVRGSLSTAQATGSLLTIDVKKNGTSVFSTTMTFDNTELTTLTAATLPVLTATPLAIADDDVITIDITQVGDGTAKGLKLYFRGAP